MELFLLSVELELEPQLPLVKEFILKLEQELQQQLNSAQPPVELELGPPLQYETMI